ncbi:MAG: metallophosphoesterase family protein [bacterium]
MEIALVSDTHGDEANIETAVDALKPRDLEFIIHAGDVTGLVHMEPFFECGVDVHLVIGNGDQNLGEYEQADPPGELVIHGTAGRLDVRGNTFCITHGHYDSFRRRLLKENPDYLVLGHTHEQRDEVRGGTRIINPGSVTSPAQSTAILNPLRDELEFIEW